jgi:hypothetical protein
VEAVIYLVIVIVIAVVAIRLGMIVAPLIGRMSRLGEADDDEGGVDALHPEPTDDADPAEPHVTPSSEEPR